MEKAENTKKELDFNRKDFINKNIEPYLALSEKELLQKKEEFKEKSSNPFDNNLYKISFINQILRCKNHIDLTNYEYQEKCHEYERLEI
ncbi:hypothetical protein IJM86_01975 [bacterium]|nr:hypothetical protein [bacterium]